MHPDISHLLSTILSYTPTSYLNCWLLYLGIQTALPDPSQDFAPQGNVCEFLNVLHIHADEANHFCAHVTKGKRD